MKTRRRKGELAPSLKRRIETFRRSLDVAVTKGEAQLVHRLSQGRPVRYSDIVQWVAATLADRMNACGRLSEFADGISAYARHVAKPATSK